MLRPDIIKYCLLTPESDIQDAAIECLHQLYLIAPKKEQAVHSLLNILFDSQNGSIVEMNAQLGVDLQCKIINLLQKCIRNSQYNTNKLQITYRQKDFKFKSSNIYEDII